MPAEHNDVLGDISSILYTQPIQFNNYNSFSDNLFSAGFGRAGQWQEVAEILRESSTKRIELISLIINAGQSEDIMVARLPAKKTIFYKSADGTVQNRVLGPGRIALGIKVETVPGSKGLCGVYFQPLFASPASSKIPQLDARLRENDFAFNHLNFNLRMAPGDLLFLGPEKFVDNQVTLASYFFRRGDVEPVVRMYLIVCTSIKN